MLPDPFERQALVRQILEKQGFSIPTRPTSGGPVQHSGASGREGSGEHNSDFSTYDNLEHPAGPSPQGPRRESRSWASEGALPFSTTSTTSNGSSTNTPPTHHAPTWYPQTGYMPPPSKLWEPPILQPNPQVDMPPTQRQDQPAQPDMA